MRDGRRAIDDLVARTWQLEQEMLAQGERLQREIAKLRAENEALAARRQRLRRNPFARVLARLRRLRSPLP